MRYFGIFVALISLAGCRSPQAAFHAQLATSAPPELAVRAAVVTDAGTSAKYRIEELVQLGLDTNPRIRQAQHRVQSLSFRIPQQLALPDPTLNTTTHLAPIETAAGRQAFSFGVNQKLVDVDRRATRAAIANDEVQAAEAELERARQEVAEKIRVASFQVLALQEVIKITRQDLESLARIEEVILRQYEVQQDVTQQDVLNVQIEQSRVENKLFELQQQEKSAAAQLARQVRLPPDTEFQLLDQLESGDLVADVDGLISQATLARPELTAQLARIRADRRKVCLAKLQARPDFTVGLNWIATSSAGISPVANGDDAVLLGIGFNLPVNKQRIRAAVCEANEAKLASTVELESIQDQIAAEVFDSVAKLDSISSTLNLLEEDIVPKAERTLELSIEEYSNGKSDFTRLIENWRSLLRYRVSIANLQAQRHQLLATLSRQIGTLEPISPAQPVANSTR